MLGSQSLLYELLARQKESGISAVCPEYSEVGMMKTRFFQVQDLSENMQLLVKPDTVLYFSGPQTATLQPLLWPDGWPDFLLTFEGTIAT